MSWLAAHFSVLRSLGMAAFGALIAGCFYFAGWAKGRLRELQRTRAILAAIFEQERITLERAQELRRLELEDRGRRLLNRN